MTAMQLMHPGLVTLLRLQARAAMRRYLRWVKRPAGILLTILGLGVVSLWLGPFMLMVIVSPPLDPEPVRTLGAPVLLLIALANILGRRNPGISFSPAEVSHLYPAPFSRRDLVTYKLVTVIASSIGIAIVTSFVFMIFRKNPFIAMTAFTLAMLFINFLAVLGAIVRDALGVFADTLARKVIVLLVLVGALAAFALSLPVDLEAGVIENLQAVFASTAVQTVLAPFAVFINIFLAQSVAAFAMWTAVAAMMTFAVAATLYRLDQTFLHVAAEAGRRKHRALEQVKRRGGMIVTGSGRVRMPALPRWAGVGPNLQRQLTAILRSARSIVFLVLGVGAFVGYLAWRLRLDAPGDAAFAGLAIAACLFSALFLAQSLRFDFRSDLDQMDWLKQLPIHPLPLVTGQVLAPVLAATFVQWLLIFVLAVLLQPNPLLAVAIAAVVVPLNLFNLSLENAFFLFAPTRGQGEGMANLKTFARNALLGMVKMMILGGAVALAGAFAAGAFFIFGQSWLAFGVVGIIILTIESVLTLPIVAFMFTQFDVSMDTPA